MGRRVAIAAAGFLTWAAPAIAQVGPVIPAAPPPPCVESHPAAVIAAWDMPAETVASARDAADAAAHPLSLGRPVTLKLLTHDKAQLPHAPGGEAQPKEYVYVGVAGIKVPKDGTYRIVTGEGMRIDVVDKGQFAETAAFGRGPHCSGKFVDLKLHAGDDTLQLNGAPYDTVKVLILPQ